MSFADQNETYIDGQTDDLPEALADLQSNDVPVCKVAFSSDRTCDEFLSIPVGNDLSCNSESRCTLSEPRVHSETGENCSSKQSEAYINSRY